MADSTLIDRGPRRLPVPYRKVEGEVRPEGPDVCTGCAREIQAGRVLFHGSSFCSLECALTAVLPGRYLG